MSLLATKSELLQITNGRSVGDDKLSVRGVEYDSRAVRGGELFVALKGAERHGHEFLAMAQQRGASLFLVEDPELLTTFHEPERLIVVPDSLVGFWQIAESWRNRLALPTLAITGSVGKTTTKEIAAALLMRSEVGTYSLKSHNNHVGVPYTLCREADGHKWAVLEVGMNHAGELAALTKIVRPDVAIITRIAPAHLEFFSSLDAIADAKCELLQGLGSNGVALVNADDEVLDRALKRNFSNPPFSIQTFGTQPQSDTRISEFKPHGLEGIQFNLTRNGEAFPVSAPLPGMHNAWNIAAAITGACLIRPELAISDAVKAVATIQPPEMRLAKVALKGGRTVLDDSYNANPASMQSILAIAEEAKRQGSRVAILLGDMLELGEESPRLHDELGQRAADLGPTFALFVGQQAPHFLAPLKKAGINAAQVESPEAAAHLAMKGQFDLLVVKASRGVGLDRAVRVLEEVYGAPMTNPEP